MRRHLGLVLLLVSAFAVLTATPASASCIVAPGTLRQRLETAPHLFVGTVTRLGGGNRAAEVQVESTWRGDAEGTVQVAGGETDAGAASSVDRTYEMGRRYLFVPYDRSGGAFRDNICTDTRPWRPRLERLRPEGAQPVAAGQPSEAPAPGTPEPEPEPAGAQRGGSFVPYIAAGAVVAVGAGAMLGLRRRTRR